MPSSAQCAKLQAIANARHALHSAFHSNCLFFPYIELSALERQRTEWRRFGQVWEQHAACGQWRVSGVRTSLDVFQGDPVNPPRPIHPPREVATLPRVRPASR